MSDVLWRPPRTCGAWLAIPCGAAGAALLMLALARVMGLQYATPPDRWLIFMLLLSLAALSLALLALEGCSWQLCLLCLLPVGTALFYRVLCLDYCSYDYYDFLGPWAAYFRDNGGFAALKGSVGNYNVPYLYFLAALSYLDVPDFYLIKLFPVLFDVVLAWGGFRLCRLFCPDNSPRPAATFCLLLLLPTVVLNSACWSQCDAIYAALLLHALACGLEKRGAASLALAGLAFSVKLQAVFLLPLWAALWFTGRVKTRHLPLFPAAFLAAIFPALLAGKPLPDILGVYIGQTEAYGDYLTLNAPSLYALLPEALSEHVSLLAPLGIAAAGLLTAGVLLALFLNRKRVTDRALLVGGVVLAIGIPFLLPHMHDRYFFLADVLTLILACMDRRRIPQAVLVQIASLGAYYAYLKLEYAFPMALGALLMLAALVWAAHGLFRALCPPAAITWEIQKHPRPQHRQGRVR